MKNMFPKSYKLGYIYEQEFEYAGIKGTAELFGWRILFYKKGIYNKTSVISFKDIIDKNLVNLANCILQYVKTTIRFKDNFDKIKSAYGDPRSIDYDLVDGIRYHYLISPEFFLTFGLIHDRLAYMDIIRDKEIIAEVLTAR